MQAYQSQHRNHSIVSGNYDKPAQLNHGIVFSGVNLHEKLKGWKFQILRGNFHLRASQYRAKSLIKNVTIEKTVFKSVYNAG